ncbi:MAG: hypothetical protein Q7U47_02325 [Paludibacter sp.]|nr:hypothetical protein [Paludibacter sp.]
MDSLGDYIYLIIIVIAALSGLLKKKKPATVLQSPQYEDDEEVEVLEDVHPKKISEQKIIEQKYKSYETDYKQISHDTATDFSKLKAQKQVVITSKFSKTNNLITSQEVEDKEVENNEYKFETLDDVKKAVIFTEIFNRKY